MSRPQLVNIVMTDAEANALLERLPGGRALYEELADVFLDAYLDRPSRMPGRPSVESETS